MIPTFFGPSDEPLFGIYHPGAASSNRSIGVLLCPPIAMEYQRSHWCLRQLAQRLSRAGFPVFRFDYFGIGDSYGEFTDGSLDRWTKDARVGVEELRDMAAVRKVAVVGLRVGATIALRLAADRRLVDSLILWDPVLDGTAYLASLRRLNENRQRRWRTSRQADRSADYEELLGFRFSDELIGQLTQYVACTYLEKLRQPPAVLLSHKNEAKFSVSINSQVVEDAGDWDVLSQFNQQLLPATIPAAIHSKLEGRQQ